MHLLGNTSLEMARDLVSGRETLAGMQEIADRAEHVSFSTSESFKRHYLREYAYWCEGARYSEKKTGPTGSLPAMKIVKAGENASRIAMKYFRPSYYIPGSKVLKSDASGLPEKGPFAAGWWLRTGSEAMPGRVVPQVRARLSLDFGWGLI